MIGISEYIVEYGPYPIPPFSILDLVIHRDMRAPVPMFFSPHVVASPITEVFTYVFGPEPSVLVRMRNEVFCYYYRADGRIYDSFVMG